MHEFSPRRQSTRRNRWTRGVGATVATAALSAPLAACGAAEEATSRAVERMVTDAAAREGVDLDVDLDADGEGTMVMRGNDGELSMSTGGSIPEDFPSVVPIPSGWNPIASTRATDGATTLWNVTFEVSEPLGAVMERFAGTLGAEFEQTLSQVNDSGEGSSAFVIWESATLTVAASAAGSASGETQVTLSVSDEPTQSD